MISSTLLYVMLVVFLATLIRSAFGFGEALIAVPLLALRLSVQIAAPLAVLLSITIAAAIVVQDWRKIHIRSTAWLFSATLFGIPLGLLLLASSHQRITKVTLASLILAFSVYSLAGRKPPELKNDNVALLCCSGFLAGVFGGAYGMNGPPLVVYGAMRRWSAKEFRATLQGYFLPASIIGMIGYWVEGLWVPLVTHYYLCSLPAAIPAIVLGRIVNHKLRGNVFLRYVYVALAGVGITLLVQALKTH